MQLVGFGVSQRDECCKVFSVYFLCVITNIMSGAFPILGTARSMHAQIRVPRMCVRGCYAGADSTVAFGFVDDAIVSLCRIDKHIPVRCRAVFWPVWQVITIQYRCVQSMLPIRGKRQAIMTGTHCYYEKQTLLHVQIAVVSVQALDEALDKALDEAEGKPCRRRKR